MPTLFWGLIAGVLLYVALSWWFSRDQQARRAMKRVVVRDIADAREGEPVRIVGRVEVDAPVRAPVSQRECAHWRLVVMERRGSGDDAKWIEIVDEHGGVEFVVRDESGKALVRSRTVHPVLELDASSGFTDARSDELDAFLSARGHYNERVRYREGVIAPGELVAVVGVGRWERDETERPRAVGYRDARAPRILVVGAPPNGQLLISDKASTTR